MSARHCPVVVLSCPPNYEEWHAKLRSHCSFMPRSLSRKAGRLSAHHRGRLPYGVGPRFVGDNLVSPLPLGLPLAGGRNRQSHGQTGPAAGS